MSERRGECHSERERHCAWVGIYRLRDDGTKDLLIEQDNPADWQITVPERDLEPGWYEVRAIIPAGINRGSRLELLRAIHVRPRQIQVRFGGLCNRNLVQEGGPNDGPQDPYIAVEEY